MKKLIGGVILGVVLAVSAQGRSVSDIRQNMSTTEDIIARCKQNKACVEKQIAKEGRKHPRMELLQQLDEQQAMIDTYIAILESYKQELKKQQEVEAEVRLKSETRKGEFSCCIEDDQRVSRVFWHVSCLLQDYDKLVEFTAPEEQWAKQKNQPRHVIDVENFVALFNDKDEQRVVDTYEMMNTNGVDVYASCIADRIKLQHGWRAVETLYSMFQNRCTNNISIAAPVSAWMDASRRDYLETKEVVVGRGISNRIRRDYFYCTPDLMEY